MGWNTKQTVKESFIADPRVNVMNYAKFIAVMAVSIALKECLENQKILQTSM